MIDKRLHHQRVQHTREIQEHFNPGTAMCYNIQQKTENWFLAEILKIFCSKNTFFGYADFDDKQDKMKKISNEKK